MEAQFAGVIQRVLCSEERARQSEVRAVAAEARATVAEHRAAAAIARTVVAQERFEKAELLLNRIESLSAEVYELGREVDQHGSIRVEAGTLYDTGLPRRTSLGKVVSNHAADFIQMIGRFWSGDESDEQSDSESEDRVSSVGGIDIEELNNQMPVVL